MIFTLGGAWRERLEKILHITVYVQEGSVSQVRTVCSEICWLSQNGVILLIAHTVAVVLVVVRTGNLHFAQFRQLTDDAGECGVSGGEWLAVGSLMVHYLVTNGPDTVNL